MIKMPRYQRDTMSRLHESACRCPGFENESSANVSAPAGPVIEIAARACEQGLPRRQSSARGFHRAVDVNVEPCATVASFSPVEGSVVLEISPAPRAPATRVMNVEAPAMTFQPGKSFAADPPARAVLMS